MVDRAAMEAFVTRLESLIVTPSKDKGEMDLNRLRELVRGHANLTIGAAKSYAAIAPHSRAYAQIALALATAYQLEFDDDSLYLSIEDDLKKAGFRDLQLRLKNPLPAPQTPKIVHLSVDAKSLAAADIYSVTRILAVDRQKSAGFIPSTLRGRIMLTFPLGNDPRPVCRIPEARLFMKKLFEVMPYLPYYLHPGPELGMGFMLFACLAPEDAFGPGDQLDLTHPTVVQHVLRSLNAVADIADRLHDSPEAAQEQVLSLLPEHYVQWIANQLANKG